MDKGNKLNIIGSCLIFCMLYIGQLAAETLQLLCVDRNDLSNILETEHRLVGQLDYLFFNEKIGEVLFLNMSIEDYIQMLHFCNPNDMDHLGERFPSAKEMEFPSSNFILGSEINDKKYLLPDNFWQEILEAEYDE